MTGVQTCALDRKSTRLNSSHTIISYAVFCLKKTGEQRADRRRDRVASLGDPHGVNPRSSPPATTVQCTPAHQTTNSRKAERVSFFFNDTATTEIYTLSLHDALPI